MKRCWTLILTFLLTVLPIGAASWRVASVTANEEVSAFHTLIIRQAKRHLLISTIHYPEWELSRLERDQEWSEWEGWAEAYDSLTLPTRGEESIISTDDFPMDIVFTEIPYDATLASLAHEGNLSWFCDMYGYDEVLLDETSDLAERKRCKMSRYVRATDTQTLLFDKLSLSDDASDLVSDVTLALLNTHLKEQTSTITLHGAPPALKVKVNGENTERDGSLVIVASGTHTLTLSANGYESKQIEVTCPQGTNVEVDAALQPITLPTLSAVCLQGEATWFVDGVEQGTASSLTLENPRLPLLLTVEKEGFLTQSHQLTEEHGIVTFDLFHDWMSDAQISKDIQKQFYSSLVSLIVSVGLTLAYPTLYNVYGDDNYLTGGFYVASQGAAVMSGISLVRSLLTYSVDTMHQ